MFPAAIRSAIDQALAAASAAGDLADLSDLSYEIDRPRDRSHGDWAANIAMVGFFAAMTDVVGADALRESVKASVPAGTEELNMRAFDRGYNFGLDLNAGKSPTVVASTSQ